MDRVSEFVSRDALTVSEAMQKMNNNAAGILFLTDEREHLTACITDGDVRRYLLAGGKMTDSAILAANKEPGLLAEYASCRNSCGGVTGWRRAGRRCGVPPHALQQRKTRASKGIR